MISQGNIISLHLRVATPWWQLDPFPPARWACPSLPSAWPRRTAWWKTWRLWKRSAPPPSSAPTRQEPSPRTGWLLPTSGLTTRSTQPTPVKIKQVNGKMGVWEAADPWINVHFWWLNQTHLPSTHGNPSLAMWNKRINIWIPHKK